MMRDRISTAKRETHVRSHYFPGQTCHAFETTGRELAEHLDGFICIGVEEHRNGLCSS